MWEQGDSRHVPGFQPSAGFLARFLQPYGCSYYLSELRSWRLGGTGSVAPLGLGIVGGGRFPGVPVGHPLAIDAGPVGAGGGGKIQNSEFGIQNGWGDIELET